MFWTTVRRTLIGLAFGVWLILPYSWGGVNLALATWPQNPLLVTALVALVFVVISLMLTTDSVRLFRLISTGLLAVDLGIGLYVVWEMGWTNEPLPLWLWIGVAAILLILWLPISTQIWQGYHRSRSVSGTLDDHDGHHNP